MALIEQMTAPSPEGRTITLRLAVGKTIGVFDDCMNGHMLKVETETETGVGLLGLFNVSSPPISFLMSVTEFPSPGKALAGEVLVRSYRASKIFGPLKRDPGNAGADPQQLFYDSLPVRGCDVYSAFPISIVPTSSREISICVLGLLGKMSGAAAMTRSSVDAAVDGKIKIKTVLKALGKLGVWISESVGLDHVSVMLQEEAVPVQNFQFVSLSHSSHAGLTKVDAAIPQILEIDIFGFWRARGLSKDSCSKEVEVEILID